MKPETSPADAWFSTQSTKPHPTLPEALGPGDRTSHTWPKQAHRAEAYPRTHYRQLPNLLAAETRRQPPPTDSVRAKHQPQPFQQLTSPGGSSDPGQARLQPTQHPGQSQSHRGQPQRPARSPLLRSPSALPSRPGHLCLGLASFSSSALHTDLLF